MSELSRDARALIEEACARDVPRAADRERVREKLAATLGAQAFAVSASEGAPLSASTLSAKKGALSKLAHASAWSKGAMAAVAGGLTATALYLAQSPSTPLPANVQAPIASTNANRTLDGESRALPQATPTVEPLQAVQANDGASEALHAQDDARASKAARKRSARAAAGSEPAPPAQAEQAASPELAPASTLAAELALLARAERALRERKPEEALELAREYTAKFGAGSLALERDAVETLAHCMQGERGSARAFLVRASSSPLARRVRKECGLE